MPNKKTQRKYGTRASVWRGGALMTPGGLTKDDLTKNGAGRIVSKRKSETARRKMDS